MVRALFALNSHRSQVVTFPCKVPQPSQATGSTQTDPGWPVSRHGADPIHCFRPSIQAPHRIRWILDLVSEVARFSSNVP